MKRALPSILTLVLLTILSLGPVASQAQTTPHPDHQDAEETDDEPVERVGRVSFLEGDVSFLRAGVTEWADAVENLPLLSGDQLYVGKGARAEIQLGRGNYIRLSESTALTIADLSHTTALLEVTAGTAIIRLERFGQAFERFEVDTPNTALMLQQDGLYRVDVSGEEQSDVIIRRGSAEVSTTDGSFKVSEGQRLLVDSSASGRLEVAYDNSSDDWDRWSYDRDNEIERVVVASAPYYVSRQEIDYHCFYGASELASHGAWTYMTGYGACWVPRVAAGWAPYRHGQWLWVPRIGWTWLASERWGWAPYHYGRWAFLPNLGWAWVPGIRSNYRYGHSYYQWRPALVAFFNYRSSGGDYIGWYPLTPGERWRRPDRRGRGDHSHLQYAGVRGGAHRPGDGRRGGPRNGVTVLPVEGFVSPDQTRRRPEAAGQEMGDRLDRETKPGLPQLTPTNRAAAPVWRRGDDQVKTRPVVAPPLEVVKRPVITRSRRAETQGDTSAPRERRLVTPRKFRDLSEVSIPAEGAAGGNENRAGGSRAKKLERRQGEGEIGPRPPGKDRSPREEGAEERGGDERASKRKRERKEEGGGSSDSESESKRTRTRFSPVPGYQQDAPPDKQPSGQEQQPQAPGVSREERRQEKQERREQRHQEKQERREERQERRKKPN